MEDIKIIRQGAAGEKTAKTVLKENWKDNVCFLTFPALEATKRSYMGFRRVLVASVKMNFRR